MDYQEEELLMKRIAIVIDLPNWAFDICAQLIKKELEGIADVDIFCLHVEPYNDNLFYMLEQIKDYDYIHFLWRKQLLLFESEKFINDVKDAGYNYNEYLNLIVPKISTAVCDHMFLKQEEIEEYKNVFNKYCSKYYVISKKIYDIYCNISEYKKPEKVIMDTYDKNRFIPQNLDRFQNAKDRTLIVGWVGGYFSYILLTIPFNPVTIVLLILLGPTLFFTSTVGYDKVEQTIKQVTQIGGSI